jgi:hypothetical protein
MAKEFVGVVEHVEVMHLDAVTIFALLESLLDGFSRAYVPRASGGR